MVYVVGCNLKILPSGISPAPPHPRMYKKRAIDLSEPCVKRSEVRNKKPVNPKGSAGSAPSRYDLAQKCPQLHLFSLLLFFF